MYHGPLRVDFLFMPGCCCASPALRLLRQVLNEEHLDPVVRIIVIKTEEEAIRHQFHTHPGLRRPSGVP